MSLGLPRRAVSTLLEGSLSVLNPAIGLVTVRMVLGAGASVVRAGTTTGTESGKLSVSQQKNLEAVGHTGRELILGRETSELFEFECELIIFMSADKTTLCAGSTEFEGGAQSR